METRRVDGVIYASDQCGISDQDHACYLTALSLNMEGTLFVSVQNDTAEAVIRVKQGASSGESFITTDSSLYGIVRDEKVEFLCLGHHREHRVGKCAEGVRFKQPSSDKMRSECC